MRYRWQFIFLITLEEGSEKLFWKLMTITDAEVEVMCNMADDCVNYL